MAPTKRTSSASAPANASAPKKLKRNNSSSLAQSTLSFSTQKPAPSGSSKKAKAVARTVVEPPSTAVNKPASFQNRKKQPVQTLDDSSASEEEQDETPEFEQPIKDVAKVVKQTKSPDKVNDVPLASRKELDVHGSEWNGAYQQAQTAMGIIAPIHAEKQTRIDHILRCFDLDMRYGPCTSLSRLARWNRAKRQGANPPQAIKDILETQQAQTDTSISESVFWTKPVSS